MRTLEKDYTNVKEMIADGWTQEEMEALKTAERSRAAACADPNGPYTWPKVNGHKILYSFFNREEKDLYNPWYRAHHSGTSSGSQMTEEKKKQWQELLDYADSKKDPVLKQKILELMPKPKNSAMQKLFGVDTVAELKSKVTLEWIIYRGKDDVRGSNPAKFTLQDAIAEFGVDFHPALTKQDVLKLVADLKNKGTDVTASIIGL